ncbi:MULTISPECIES: hypothetical protein [Vibrio]|jgi:hypothetical protein|uniref:hypothetical protein n=1 Tax=Vibrio TaxID=662 RepID=UPI000E54BA14|nr:MULTISPECIES: hypothetical protein [Vibrio]AXT74230.1 hypothetical protein DBX26_24990 [Vibrio sp. dhg]EJM7154683.1 hypothetical protein [Vibrio parahaemolyticus]EJS2611038.1 hypothetical protein [Vibrio alginolyticus]MCA2452353.1 hypothetical protein [Vibrio alginolyticus]MCA2476339.1 hypothetical protein [Vibrio alginolyticus]
MRATLYKNSGLEQQVERFTDECDLELALENVMGRFPKAKLIVDGNHFKWVQVGDNRILISR